MPDIAPEVNSGKAAADAAVAALALLGRASRSHGKPPQLFMMLDLATIAAAWWEARKPLVKTGQERLPDFQCKVVAL